MATPYIGEIRLFAGNFAPSGWAICDGRLLAISNNTALFSLLGTLYGGDGQNTFALPDLRGRIPVHMGTNPNNGITYVIGASSGTEQVTLTVSQLAAHSHVPQALSSPGNQQGPAGAVWAASSSLGEFSQSAPNGTMSVAAISPVGGGQPHENRMPYLAINFIIALFGIFPSRN